MSDPAPQPAVKPGYATTEGWLTFIIALCGVAPTTLGTNAPQLVQVFGLVTAMLTAIAYQYHRTKAKAGAPLLGQLLTTLAEPVAPEQPKTPQAGFVTYLLMPLLALALLGGIVAIAACTHQQRVAMSGEFKACAKADLGQLMPTGLTLAQDVAAKIKGNAPTLTSDLDAAAVKVGVDAVKCAAVAAFAALEAPSGSGAATSQPLPGVAVAKQWLAAHGGAS